MADYSANIALQLDEDSGNAEPELTQHESKKESSPDESSSLPDSKPGERYFDASSWLLIIVINFANLVNGIYMAIPGPTLLFLAQQVSRRVGMVSIVLAGRSVGNLAGAFAATLISKCTVKYWDATMRLGVSFIAYGLSTFPIPFVHNIWILTGLLTTGGFLFGFTNTGFLAVQLNIWGEKKSRPLMQVYQAVSSIGATIAPLLAAPFLEMAKEREYDRSAVPSCLRGKNASSVIFGNATEPPTSSSITFGGVDPVAWVYVIIGVLYLLVASIMITISFLGIEGKARQGNEVVSETRNEEPISKIACLLFCVIIFYAFLAAAVNIFSSYLYSVSYCSGLEFSVSKAYTMNCLYWGVFIIGRLFASIVAVKIQPSTLITCCIIGLLVSSSCFSAAGEYNEWVAWVSTAIWAFSISPLFGSGISWISRITNVSGRYAVVFEIGAAMGAVAAFLLAGVLFDYNPYAVIHLVTGIIASLATSYVGMRVAGRMHMKRKWKALEGVSNEEKDENFENLLI